MIIKDLIQGITNYYIKPKRPIMAYFYITSKCNLNCIFCEFGNYEIEYDSDLDLNEVKSLINAIRNWGIDKIYISGGEPFLRKDIWEILQYCQDKNLTVFKLITNGTTLDKLTTRETMILKKSVKTLGISLDSVRPEIHDHIRGKKGVFEKVENFLKNNLEHCLPPIYLSSTITNQTLEDIPGIVHFAHHYRIRHVDFHPLNFISNMPGFKTKGEKQSLLIRKDKLDSLDTLINEGIRLAKKFSVSTNLELAKIWIRHYFMYAKGPEYFFDFVLKKFICTKPFNYLYIAPWGEILQCALLKTTANIERKELKKTWQYQAYRFKNSPSKRCFQCRSCFCDFPGNFMYCLLYHPLSNYRLIFRLFGYYLERIILEGK